MTDRFDELLSRELSQVPPPDSVVQDTNPWRRALELIMIGQVLSMLRLEQYLLDYVLPAVGYVYLLLGHRILRKENGALKAGWALSILQALLFAVNLCIDATFLSTQDGLLYELSGYILFGLQLLGLLHLLCLHITVDILWEHYNPPMRRQWAHILVMLALVFGVVFRGLLASASIFLLLLTVSDLLQLSRTLSDGGFTMEAAPVRLSNPAFTGLAVGVTVAAVVLCGITLRKAPMDFAPVEDENVAQVAAIEARLIELGMPAAIVEDLSDADVLRCEGAIQVRLEDQQYEDALNARVTVIAIQIPPIRQSDDCWVILSHFQYLQAPVFTGTDAISTRHDVVSGTRWWIERKNNASGRVLYDLEGETHVSEFYDITYGQDYDRVTQTACFSFPGGGENYRGYLLYTAELVNSGCILYVIGTLTHQTALPNFPAQAPVPEARRAGFRENQSQIHFYPDDEE